MVGAGIGALSLGWPQAASAQEGLADGTLSLRDFGAVGDGVQDDAPALQRALEALASLGGGVLMIPAGIYALRSPVRQNFATKASAITMRGLGSSSRLLVGTGDRGPAVAVANVNSVTAADLTFVGRPGERSDAVAALSLEYCRQAVVRECAFLGVSAGERGRGVLTASRTNLRVQTSAFLGCGGSSAFGVPVILVEDWQSVVVTDTDFIDWGWLNGEYHSKTPIAAPYAWIRIGDTGALDQALAQGQVVLERLRFDEGAYRAVSCSPNPASSAKIAHIKVAGIRVNGASWHDARGLHVQHVEDLDITDSWFGYTQNRRRAIHLLGVDRARVARCHCTNGMNVIFADPTCGEVEIRDTEYASLESQCRMTTIIDANVASELVDAPAAVERHTLVSWTSDRAVAMAKASDRARESPVAGVAVEASIDSGGPDRVRVVVDRGSIVEIRSDGSSPIAANDPVTCSEKVAGRLALARDGVTVGWAVSAAPAQVDALVKVRLDMAISPSVKRAPILLSGWQNRGEGYEEAGYEREASGLVHLCGVISGGATSPGTTVLELPNGYRPQRHRIFATPARGGLSQFLITSDGRVVIRSGASSDFTSLDGISFATS